MITPVRNFDNLARRVAGARAEEMARDLYEACVALEAQFHALGAEVDITIGVEPDPKQEFRLVVAYSRRTGDTVEPWDRVFNFTPSRVREIQRTMIGDVGLQIAERMWIELTQFSASIAPKLTA